MKIIQLTQGQVALIDDEDFEEVNQYKWHAERRLHGFYARRTDKLGNHHYLHRFLMGNPEGQVIMHLNGNGLDNRRSNLQRGNQIQNGRGHWNRPGKKSRGVTFCKQTSRFKAQINHGGNMISIGRYDTLEEAMRARDAKARELGWPEEGMNFPLTSI